MSRSELHATLVVVVLVVVGVIALWPRPSDDGGTAAPSAPSSAGSASSTARGDATPDLVTPDPAALAAARRDAALAPCPMPPADPAWPADPRPPADPARPAGPMPPADPARPALEGLALDCLGAPGRVDLGRSLAGRTTLVNLWASWCGPCREELPALSAYAAEPGAAAVLGVDVDDSPTAALALLSALDVTYPSVTDPDQVVARRTGAAPVLPASVVVRPDGSVVPVPAQVLRTTGQVRAAVDTALATGRVR